MKQSLFCSCMDSSAGMSSSSVIQTLSYTPSNPPLSCLLMTLCLHGTAAVVHTATSCVPVFKSINVNILDSYFFIFTKNWEAERTGQTVIIILCQFVVWRVFDDLLCPLSAVRRIWCYFLEDYIIPLLLNSLKTVASWLSSKSCQNIPLHWETKQTRRY